MRDINKVLDRILELIPKELKEYREKLEYYKSQVKYIAPEEAASYWRTIALYLCDNELSIKDEVIREKIRKVWINEES